MVGLHGIDILILPSGQLTVTLAAQLSTMLGNELEVLSINLQVGGGNAILVIGELLLDQLPGELWLPLALEGQSLQQLENRSFRVTSKEIDQPVDNGQ